MLAADHRWQWEEWCDARSIPRTRISEVKQIAADGFRLARDRSSAVREFGALLLDAQYSSEVIAGALAAGLTVGTPAERAGAFPLTWSTDPLADALIGTFVKVLVRFRPDDSEEIREGQWEKLAALKQEKARFEAALPTVMVMQEMPEPRPTFVLRRGAYDAPTEKVERGVPAVLPPLLKEFPNNRLGLANWLVSAEHPLTARVQVNRYWQMLFGTGIVRTVEDFGAQGEPPSHPELLDWLATEFRNGTGSSSDLAAQNPLATARGTVPAQWDLKSLLKTIVMSATYRQSSKITPELLQRDPNNRLLAHGPRFRLSAEMLRDQALFASGLLVEKLGGPSVKTYQPADVYKGLVFGSTVYDQEKGEGLWRRSLYTFWKRTILSPNMLVLDATARSGAPPQHFPSCF